MAIVFSFFFFETGRKRIGHRPFWVGWSQKWDSRVFTSEWSCVFSVCMFDLLKAEARGWVKMGIVFKVIMVGAGVGGSLCLCSVCVWPAGRFSDGHSFSWPLPLPGRCPAGTRSWASWATPAVRDSQEKRFVDKVITWLLLPLCHTHLLLLYLLLCCVPYSTSICCNVTTVCDAKAVITITWH